MLSCQFLSLSVSVFIKSCIMNTGNFTTQHEDEESADECQKHKYNLIIVLFGSFVFIFVLIGTIIALFLNLQGKKRKYKTRTAAYNNAGESSSHDAYGNEIYAERSN